jgi:hypothetical protein
VNAPVNPARPLTQPLPASLSSGGNTALSAASAAVTPNPPLDPAAVPVAAGGQHKPKPNKSTAPAYGASGERLRVDPSFDPREHTLVQVNSEPQSKRELCGY